MLTTAKEIIKRSLRLISATASGEEPTASEYTDCLNALTTLVEAWGIEKLMSTGTIKLEHPVLASVSSFSIGPTGDLIVPSAPTFIDYVFISVSPGVNVELPLAVDRLEFDSKAMASSAGFPSIAYYDKTNPILPKLLFSCGFPQGSLVTFGSANPAPSFAALNTAVELAAGLKRAIEYNLAVEVAPEFQAQPSPLVMQIAASSKATFKLHNFYVEKLSIPEEFVGRGGFDMKTG